MRIAQIATLATPVRRTGSGSIESLIWLLDRELTNLGHEVTVFAIAGSEANGKIIATLPGTYATNGSPDDWQLCEWINLCRAIECSDNFDVLHSHNYLYGLPLQSLSRAPMVHTTHIIPDDDSARLRLMVPDACVTSISRFQWSAYPQFQQSAIIHHGVDPSQFTFRLEPEDYLCYLGRFTSGKGPLQAIAAAKSVGIRLVLAGPRNDYFNKYVEPLVDGEFIQYVGRGIGGAERNEFLGRARALLYHIQEPEPFGLVMIEAMMCGTPIVALNLGAVPEIIDEGVTGYFVETREEFSEAIMQAVDLNRTLVRERSLNRFSAERMARQYLQVYKQLI